MAPREFSWEHLPLRRVPAQARSRDKVMRALEAADRIVAEEGLEGINLPKVAERAGVSVGALYQYLPDRNAIVAALVWRYHARLESLLDEVVAQARRNPPSSDPVGYVIDAVADIYREEESARSLRSSAEGPALETDRQAHRLRMATKVADLLQVVGVPTASPGASGRPVAVVAFITADAIVREAFAVAEPQRSAIIEELRRLARSYIQPQEPQQPAVGSPQRPAVDENSD
jgi:AcrR family transcriptional regulator